MSVKIIPISPEYRENWDRVFGGVAEDRADLKDLREEARVVLRDIAKNVLQPDTGTNGPIYMTTPLPASWGMVNGRPF